MNAIELDVILPEDERYETCRRAAIWNGRVPEARPAAIVFAHNDDEIAAALELAKEKGLRVSVRSGGHNFVGNSIRDGGLLLDLSRMTAVQIDAEARTAIVEPAADNEAFIAELEPLGLTFSVGHCPSVCLGGFLLGGGLGFNTGAWGYANESVIGIDVITADGRRVHASETENSDLFWAARGSGPGFFGVVTRFHLRLGTHPRGLWSDSLVLPLSMLDEVATWLDETTPLLDPRIEPMGWIGFLDGHEVGAEAGGTHSAERVVLLNSLIYADSDEEAQELLKPLLEAPFADRMISRTTVKTSFTELFDFQRVLYHHGRRYAVDCHWTDTPPAEQPLAELVAAMESAPSTRTHVLWQLPFGNYRKEQPDMAASILGRYFVSIYAVWEDPEADEANIGWLRETLAPFEEISTGHYAGDVDLTARPTRPARTLSDERWQRYLALKSEWDPENLFQRHLNAPEA
ncbi:FAD-binding oxidoreductase [Leucobacter sp. USHLN153]|uniref:FAD-binding oxidoreductase n=1 Tax=Leucobacter sp. USHLN153 TaxID=3081268 RepID=UPI0030186B24